MRWKEYISSWSTLLIVVGLMYMIWGCAHDNLAPEVFMGRVETLSLNVEGGTKVSVASSNGAVTWVSGDEIAVLTTSTTKTCAVNASSGHVSVPLSANESRQGYAVYPESWVQTLTTSVVAVTYPIDYDIKGVLSSTNAPIPMVAINSSNSNTLEFKQIGGILRITATVPSGTKYIEVTTGGDYMCGVATVLDPGLNSSTSSISSGTHTVTFTVHDSGLDATTDVVLNLPVPCGTYSSLRVKAKDGSNQEIAIYSDNTSRTIAHGRGSKETVDFLAPPKDLFTINADGGKVVIAHGNLKMETKNGTTTYAIQSPEYYAYCSDHSWNTTTRDLFQWPEIANSSNGPKTFAIDGYSWYTLTSDEWKYLFYSRTGCSRIGDTDNARFAKAKVDGMNGLIIFPDNYTHPSGVAVPVNINVKNQDFPASLDYDGEEWDKMAEAGAVFLPAYGYYENYESTYYYDVEGDNGYYWTSTDTYGGNAIFVNFDSRGIQVAEVDYGNYVYFSVRLVRDYSE